MLTGNSRVAVLVVIITLGMLLAVYILILVKYVFMRRKRKQEEDGSVFQSPISVYPWRINGDETFTSHIVGAPKCERVQPRSFEELTKVQISIQTRVYDWKILPTTEGAVIYICGRDGA